MKTFKALLFILVAALILSACGSEKESALSSEETPLSSGENELFSEENGSATIDESNTVSENEEASDNSELDTSSVVDTRNGTFNAIYKGVNNFGDSTVTSDKKDFFRYIFEIDGNKVIYSVNNGTKSSNGSYTYEIQNSLKRDREYIITVENNKVVSASEVTDASSVTGYTPLVQGVPGEKTLLNFIKTAFAPVGTTLYIYGGGWDWQDVGSSVQATTIGISQDWVKFFNEQNSFFTYRNDADLENGYYPYGAWNEYFYAGLDCSGYVGWAIYNLLNTESGKDGYVLSASKMAKAFADNGWGIWSDEPIGKENPLLPGDIVSKSGHVYICVGSCDDGSFVILHSTPTDSISGMPGGGVQLSAVGENENCKAYALVCEYMEKYSAWSERYTPVVKSFSEYTDFSSEELGRFSWYISGDEKFLSDNENIRTMSASEVLKLIFSDDAK